MNHHASLSASIQQHNADVLAQGVLASLDVNIPNVLMPVVTNLVGRALLSEADLAATFLRLPQVRTQMESQFAGGEPLSGLAVLKAMGHLTNVVEEVAQQLPSQTVESEPNDQLSNANPISLSDTVEGVTNESQDKDYFSFDVTQGGDIDVAFTHPNGPGSEGATIAVAVLNEAGEVISERDYRGDATLLATLDQAGRYYLRVEDQRGYNTDGVNGDVEGSAYQLKTTFKAVDNTAFDAASNDSLSRAVDTLGNGEVLQFGSQLSGSVGASQDVDVFKLSALQGGEITLGFAHPNGLGTEGATMQLSLLDTQGGVVSSREYRGDETLHATVREAGDYYVRIEDLRGYSTDGVNGDYEPGRYLVTTELTTETGVAYDDALNDSLSSAIEVLADGVTGLTFGHALVGSVAASQDRDVFKLTAEQGGAITMDFQHPNGPGSEGASMKVALLDENGVAVGSWDATGHATFNATVSQAGDYYLQVEDNRGYSSDGVNGPIEDLLYRVDTQFTSQANTAYDTANNDTLANAVTTLADGETPINTGHTIIGSMGASQDSDTFKLIATETGNAIVDFMHPNGLGSEGASMKVALLDAQGELLQEQVLRGNGSVEASFQEDSSYYLRISDERGYSSAGVNGDVEPDLYQVDFLIG